METAHDAPQRCVVRVNPPQLQKQGNNYYEEKRYR